MKTEMEGGADRPSNMPEGFVESFESQDKFRGWGAFGKTWDVSDADPWTIIFRDKSIDEEWNEVLLAKVPVLELDNGPAEI